MQSQRIHYLLDRYIKGLLTGEEQRELAKVLQDPAQESFFRGELVRLLEAERERPFEGMVDPGSGSSVRGLAGQGEMTTEGAAGKTWEPLLQRVLSVDKTAGDASGGAVEDASWTDESKTGILRRVGYGLRRWSVAAILLLLAGGGVLLFLHGREARPIVTVAAKPAARIQPGANKAVLTLANGQQIILNDAQNGTIGQQGNIRVVKLDSGQLAYGTPTAESPADQLAKGPLYNTITTPRGGQYQVTLADGTKVWLNAESSLRFPTAFTGKDREVELTGEAYFEVKADKDKPFLVQAGQTETRVLGTNFNIMAYSDEGAVKTTLLEGAVSMGLGTKSALLQPGEQGQYDDGKNIIATRAVNTRAVVAWKDGYYFFDRTPVKSVMRQIARWYDVTIVYKGAAPEDEIVGKLPRTADVREVLHIMELIGIHFKIEGKTIIVGG
jgi:transmembrane sensor